MMGVTYTLVSNGGNGGRGGYGGPGGTGGGGGNGGRGGNGADCPCTQSGAGAGGNGGTAGAGGRGGSGGAGNNGGRGGNGGSISYTYPNGYNPGGISATANPGTGGSAGVGGSVGLGGSAGSPGAGGSGAPGSYCIGSSGQNGTGGGTAANGEFGSQGSSGQAGQGGNSGSISLSQESGGSCPSNECNEGGQGGPVDYCLYPGSGCPGNYDNTGACCQPHNPSPIIIDVDGSGFHLTNASDGITFDFYGTGHSITTSWTASGSTNAWLVLDRNSNGIIDDAREMFGNITAQPPSVDANGFLALALYDKPDNGGNGDGQISSQDAIFSSLRLWQDTNHNGFSETSELNTLPSLRVIEMDLDYSKSKDTDEFGNQFKYRARVRDAEGIRGGRWAWDVFLTAR
jgi:hypothetical protein